MSSLRYAPSPTLIELERMFGTQRVSAADLLKALFKMHPEYGGGLARRARLSETAYPVALQTASMDEWITRLARFFEFDRDPEFHGRLLVIGIALDVDRIRDDLIRTGLLQAIAAEVREGVPALLTPSARKAWEGIEATWRRGAGSSSTAPDLPSKAPPPRVQTQQPVPDPASGSAPSAHGAEETLQSGAIQISHAQADAPAAHEGHTEAHESVPTSASETTLIVPGGSVMGSDAEVPEYLQRNVAAPVRRKGEPDVPAPSRDESPIPRADTTDQETVPAHPDDPAVLDTLARRPFARCIANRMDEVWRGRDRRPTRRGEADTGSGGAFMLHLHGPWGSGKSSILNFLRDELQDEARKPEDRWVVVEFNAWRHQRIRPPWWALIRDVYAQSARQLPTLRGLWLRVRWWAWRVRADWLPVAAAAVIITLAVLVITGLIDPFPDPAQTAPGTPAQRQADDAWKGVELALKLLTGALAAWGTVFAVSRSLAFGSARAAQAYTDLKSDPLGPIVRLFQRLTASIRQPVAVFVDDLDRCDGKYVVELLEGIQTLFRTAPVTYVVAADRKWICASFQQGYKDFGDDIGEAGRPLGYLFLDKLFQVSASVPRPAPVVQRAYWGALLRAAGTADAGAMEAQRRQAEQQAQREVGDRKTTEELQAFVQAAADPVQQEGRRAVAAERITTPEAQRETQKHLLEGFADLLEPNPRSMKRLVNAYGLHQATHFLEHRHVPPDALARWTLIELRWPLLADHLSSHPESLAALGTDGEGVPAALKPLLRDDAVRDVVRGGPGIPLDEATLRQIVGSGDARTPVQEDVRGDADPDAGAAAGDPPMIAIEGDVGEEAAGAPELAVQTQG